MSFTDLYGNSEHRRNFALKLNISAEEYKEVMKPTNKYPIEPPIDSEKRLERLYDLFTIIFADNVIDNEEMVLLRKYAIGLGYSTETADKIIKRSVKIFSGKIEFEDYSYLLKR